MTIHVWYEKEHGILGTPIWTCHWCGADLPSNGRPVEGVRSFVVASYLAAGHDAWIRDSDIPNSCDLSLVREVMRS